MSNTSIHANGAGATDPEQFARERLSERHLSDLRASGLSWATIVRAGFRTAEDPKAVGDLLRRRDARKLGGCLLLPYFDLDGDPVAGYVRAKPDCPPPARKEGDKPAKYLSPTKAPIRAYFPPGAGAAIRDASRPVVLTEGEKKALAVWQCEVAVIGLAGVECWSRRRSKGADGRAQGPRRLLDDLAGLPWRGRVVHLLFDSDIAQKRDVQRAEASLARVLTDLGAVVKLVRIPSSADGGKLGIDDYLVRQRDPVAALQALCDRAAD
ncbi:MAG TPA: DUF3854 domain-containing protein, partial [Gemmataceae bacterium]|nr:DUF3854 domain-containing protein [Gemmataceae bacterium]